MSEITDVMPKHTPISWQGGGWCYIKSRPAFRFLYAGVPPFAKEATETLAGDHPCPDGYLEEISDISASLGMSLLDLSIASALDGIYRMIEGDGGVEEQARDVLIHKEFPDVPDNISKMVRLAMKGLSGKDRVKFNADLHVEVINFREYIAAYSDWLEGVHDFIKSLKKSIKGGE